MRRSEISELEWCIDSKLLMLQIIKHVHTFGWGARVCTSFTFSLDWHAVGMLWHAGKRPTARSSSMEAHLDLSICLVSLHVFSLSCTMPLCCIYFPRRTSEGARSSGRQRQATHETQKYCAAPAFWGEELHNLRHWWTLIGMEATKVEQCWTLLNIIEQRVGWRYSFSTRWRHRRLMVLLRRCILRHGLFAKKSADLWLLFTLSSREWKVSFQKWFANVDLCSHMYSRLLKQKCT